MKLQELPPEDVFPLRLARRWLELGDVKEARAEIQQIRVPIERYYASKMNNNRC